MRCILINIMMMSLPLLAVAEDKIELKTTIIKANTELPKILYVVPWQDTKEKKASEQKLVLHSLFGDLFDPVRPAPPSKNKNQSNKN